MLCRTLPAASGGVKLTRIITLLDGSVGFNMAVKMFDNIALCFTTVSYGRKRLYNIKHTVPQERCIFAGFPKTTAAVSHEAKLEEDFLIKESFIVISRQDLQLFFFLLRCGAIMKNYRRHSKARLV